MTGRVVVVGDLVTDVLAALAGPLAPGSDVAGRIRVTGGGQAANTAAWLARLGVPVTLAATVGDDPAGRDRVAELAEAGVDCATRRVGGVPTGTLIVLTDRDDRTMVADRGAADHLRPADIDAALDGYADARHLHLSGYALLGDGSHAAGRHALAAARARGLTTSVCAASAEPLRRVGATTFLDWVRGVDLLLANAAEAAVLGAPAADPAAQARALTAGAGAAVVTLGPAGAHWAAPAGTDAPGPGVPAGTTVVTVAPPDPVTVADPTGAGDAFTAGLLAARLAGAEPEPALHAGARLGAEAVATLGARPAAS